ncbi:MAG TPA: hypothetical protein DDW49_03685 [Deltaproteobacteria bacterium]|nr:MAG: hypothetical protein A2048_09315 [Deltaproteobacteria bacterium GWA2_45_12]HBF12482.1 hypothetical protein [Deltaproteobacteria bacterium]
MTEFSVNGGAGIEYVSTKQLSSGEGKELLDNKPLTGFGAKGRLGVKLELNDDVALKLTGEGGFASLSSGEDEFVNEQTRTRLGGKFGVQLKSVELSLRYFNENKDTDRTGVRLLYPKPGEYAAPLDEPIKQNSEQTMHDVKFGVETPDEKGWKAGIGFGTKISGDDVNPAIDAKLGYNIGLSESDDSVLLFLGSGIDCAKNEGCLMTLGADFLFGN